MDIAKPKSILVGHQLGAVRCGGLVDVWVFDQFYRDAFCRGRYGAPGAAAPGWICDAPTGIIVRAVHRLAFGGLVLGIDVPGSAQLLYNKAGTHLVLGADRQHDCFRDLGVERGGD